MRGISTIVALLEAHHWQLRWRNPTEILAGSIRMDSYFRHAGACDSWRDPLPQGKAIKRDLHVWRCLCCDRGRTLMEDCGARHGEQRWRASQHDQDQHRIGFGFVNSAMQASLQGVLTKTDDNLSDIFSSAICIRWNNKAYLMLPTQQHSNMGIDRLTLALYIYKDNREGYA